MFEEKVPEFQAGQRIDKLCLKILDKAPKSFVYRMFRKKNIVLNGKKIKGDEKAIPGDVLAFYLSEDTTKKFSTRSVLNNIDLQRKNRPIEKKQKFQLTQESLIEDRIVYEDEHILVYDKPVGILSQPDGKNANVVSQYASYAAKNNITYDALESYGVCNRLDRNTSGLIIIGKNALSLRLFNQAIRSKEIEKYYLALVFGKIEDALDLKDYQAKDAQTNRVYMSQSEEAKDYIHTKVQAISYSNDLDVTLVKVQLLTGKTHQIRHHLASVGHPILGDNKYGNQDKNKVFNNKYNHNYHIDYQLLHSYSYEFLDLQEPLTYLNHRQFVVEPRGIFGNIINFYFENR